MKNKFRILVAVGMTLGCGCSAAADVDVTAIGAVLFDEPLTHLEMLELKIHRSPVVSLGASLAHVSTQQAFEEVQLRAHVSFTAKPAGWTVESRNLLSQGSRTELRYRHRLRVIRPELFDRPGLSVRIYDEHFLRLDGRGSLRNMFAVGVGAALGRSGLAEVYHAWSDEHAAPDTRYWLLVLSWRAN